VASITVLAARRTDLLAQVAGLAIRFSEGTLDAPVNSQLPNCSSRLAPSWPRALRAIRARLSTIDRAAALVTGMIGQARAPAAASSDQLGRGRPRPAPIPPGLTNYR
jgi:hypothetical protein